ncbi:MAG: hypothetical protein IPL83_02430 [Bdellovibrionales bacterium]|nr:hypothetical protein [Bdellovibrionales bacterium]
MKAKNVNKASKANTRKVPPKLVKVAAHMIDRLSGERGLINLHLRPGIGPIARAVRKTLPRKGVSRDQIELAVIAAFEQLMRREISEFLSDDRGYFAYLGECTLHQYAKRRKD